MIKCFVTGDLHIGKKYDNYPKVKDKLIQSRFDCLQRSVEYAEKAGCDLFVITGDTFDNTHSIKLKDIEQVVNILSEFDGSVLVLPGNHDFYVEGSKLWEKFIDLASAKGGNITLMNKYEPKTLDVRDETVTVYPAYCNSKHSKENRLDWIKKAELDDSTYHIGVAHGSVEGESLDDKIAYFPMGKKELEDIPVDAWFIGHTHLPFPNNLKTDSQTPGYKLFNPGTPEQTDVSNKTEGVCFIVSLESKDGKTVVTAGKYVSGKIRYIEKKIVVNDVSLRSAIEKELATEPDPANSIIRLRIAGSVTEEELSTKEDLYTELLVDFLDNEVKDEDLGEIITHDRINNEFSELSLAAKFLNELTDPKELQMAYQLIKKYRE